MRSIPQGHELPGRRRGALELGSPLRHPVITASASFGMGSSLKHSCQHCASRPARASRATGRCRSSRPASTCRRSSLPLNFVHAGVVRRAARAFEATARRGTPPSADTSRSCPSAPTHGRRPSTARRAGLRLEARWRWRTGETSVWRRKRANVRPPATRTACRAPQRTLDRSSERPASRRGHWPRGRPSRRIRCLPSPHGRGQPGGESSQVSCRP